MRIKILGCSILLLAGSVFASDSTIYKWVDDKGIVHFSNSHPANKESTEVNVQVAYSSTNEEISEPDMLIEKSDNKLVEKNKKMFSDNCKSAKANKKILSNFNRILIQDEKGTDTLLTDKDIKTQLALTQQHIEIYCNVDNK